MAHAGQHIHNRTTSEQITFLQTAGDGAHDLIIELYMDAGQVGVPAHIHMLQSETFEVLEGELHAFVNARQQIVKQGDRITIPAGTPHRFGTASSGAVRLRITLTPALETETFFESLAYASEQGRMNLFQIAVLARELDLGFRAPGVPLFVQTVLFAILAPVAQLLGYRARYSR